MEEKKIETIKDWPELLSVRDIQVFLNFANFYRRFIKNFSKIAVLLTLMLRTTNKPTGNKLQSTYTKNQNALGIAGRADMGKMGRNIKNLSTIANLAKSKKSKLTKPKKSDLSNAKANFQPDFLSFKAKKTFIHLQKAFTKALIFRHFNPKHYF